MIISTGIAEIKDIELAIETCKKAGNNNITILKCTSAYPANPKEANLATIDDIKQRFKVRSGLSDHTLGIEAPMIAVAMGATVIEKHFILDKSIGGADAHFSLDENEFKKMVDAVRLTEKMMGEVDYEMTKKKMKSREFSRSLFIVKDVKKGELISNENIRSIRPGYGLHPKFLSEIIGKEYISNQEKGTPISWDMIQ